MDNQVLPACSPDPQRAPDGGHRRRRTLADPTTAPVATSIGSATATTSLIFVMIGVKLLGRPRVDRRFTDRLRSFDHRLEEDHAHS
jgi:hypothetical protein